MKRNTIVVHLIGRDSLSPEAIAGCLHAHELERAERFKFQEHARAWSHYRATLRHVLGNYLELPPKEVPLELTAHGKPVLSGPFEGVYFNLTHCDELALIAISHLAPVGIDVEPLDRADGLIECETTFCHPDEIIALPEEVTQRSMRLLEIWTAKEAFLKATGTGLLAPPDQVRVHLEDGLGSAISRDGTSHPVIQVRHPLLSGHLAHLCSLQPIAAVEMISQRLMPEGNPQSNRQADG